MQLPNFFLSNATDDTWPQVQYSYSVPFTGFSLSIYRAPLVGGPQVAWMLQVSWGRGGKQEQEQNSPVPTLFIPITPRYDLD